MTEKSTDAINNIVFRILNKPLGIALEDSKVVGHDAAGNEIHSVNVLLGNREDYLQYEAGERVRTLTAAMIEYARLSGTGDTAAVEASRRRVVEAEKQMRAATAYQEQTPAAGADKVRE